MLQNRFCFAHFSLFTPFSSRRCTFHRLLRSRDSRTLQNSFVQEMLSRISSHITSDSGALNYIGRLQVEKKYSTQFHRLATLWSNFLVVLLSEGQNLRFETFREIRAKGKNRDRNKFRLFDDENLISALQSSRNVKTSNKLVTMKRGTRTSLSNREFASFLM